MTICCRYSITRSAIKGLALSYIKIGSYPVINIQNDFFKNLLYGMHDHCDWFLVFLTDPFKTMNGTIASHAIFDGLMDFNSMSTSSEVFHARRFGCWVHCIFIWTFLQIHIYIYIYIGQFYQTIRIWYNIGLKESYLLNWDFSVKFRKYYSLKISFSRSSANLYNIHFSCCLVFIYQPLTPLDL